MVFLAATAGLILEFLWGEPLELAVAHLLVHADHLSLPHQIEAVADAITMNPAKAMRRTDYGTEVGCRADLVVLPVETVHEAIRTRPRPIAVLKGGKHVA